MTPSLIEQFFGDLDSLDVGALTARMTPGCRLLSADGRRAEGIEAASELLGEFVSQLRSTAHRITAHWHIDDVWIAEVEADYELADRLLLTAVPRAFVIREQDGAIADVRVYGAHERRLADHGGDDEGMRIAGRWLPPL